MEFTQCTFLPLFTLEFSQSSALQLADYSQFFVMLWGIWIAVLYYCTIKVALSSIGLNYFSQNKKFIDCNRDCVNHQ